MTTDSCEAWILHKRWSGDTSAQVLFFTREYGLLSCLYKGCRTPKKQAALQPFIPLWLAVNQRRDWFYVQRLEMRAPSLPLIGPVLFSGLYINELIHYALGLNDAHPEVYHAYESALYALAGVVDRRRIEVVLRRFEWLLLKQCGYQLSLSCDLYGQAIDEHHHYQFMPGEGFKPAVQGLNGKHLLAFASDTFDDIDTLKTVKRFMRRAIEHLLDGRALKARSLFVNR